MAAASQGDEEDEERRALERELAEELAALSAQDVGFSGSLGADNYQNGSITSSDEEEEEDYVRLDLEKVLQQVIFKSSSHELQLVSSHGGATCQAEEDVLESTSWELLLQSVERSDREFFQPFHEDLVDIRTTILDVKPLVLETEKQKKVIVEVDSIMWDPEDREIDSAVSQSKQTDNLPVLDQTVNLAPAATDNKLENGRSRAFSQPESVRDISLELDTTRKRRTSIHDAALADANSTLDVVAQATAETSTLSDADPTITTEQFPEDDPTLRMQLQQIAKQQEAREIRRWRAQEKHQKERDEAASLLRSLQDEFEAQERNAEIARQETQERSFMANEELQCRLLAAAVREAHENTLMALADEAAREVAMELARIQDAINKEITQMTAEDQAERYRMRVEQQLRGQRQEAAARCHFSAVLMELIKHHDIQQQVREQQTRRERRECVQMRAEEAYVRRVIAETRALREQQERERNRAFMLHEDELSDTQERFESKQKLKAKERVLEENCRVCMEEEETRTRSAWAFIESLQNQNEERSRFTMEQEEERCRCAWLYLTELARAEAEERGKQHELHRLRIATEGSAGLQDLERVYRQHLLVKCVEKWKRWYEQCMQEDLVQAQTAAKRIQMWHRSRRHQLVSVDPPLVLEDFSEDEDQPQVGEDDEEVTNDEVDANCSTSQKAALRLQSTFRGFHVRQKFANALALAQAVGEHEEGDSFDAVDLDDLIELPPELVDGWEDPVLPPASILTHRKYPLQPEVRCYERPELVDNNEVEDEVADKNLENSLSAVKSTPSASTNTNPPKELNLAATLWNKMKRTKQRQLHARQEKQRQQDPSYRVQKILRRKPASGSAPNQNGNQTSYSILQVPEGNQKTPNMVSWSLMTNAKKKPKVKVPSLVERLRRQTMAER